MEPPASTPWPMIAQPQCAQRGATAWIAHSKESKTCVAPPTVISIVLSYSFPHTSHVAIAFASRPVDEGQSPGSIPRPPAHASLRRERRRLARAERGDATGPSRRTGSPITRPASGARRDERQHPLAGRPLHRPHEPEVLHRIRLDAGQLRHAVAHLVP